MEYTKVLYFLVLCIIILTVLVLYLFFPLLGLSSPLKNSRQIQSLTIVEQSGEINVHSGTYIVTGTAQNTGTTTIVKVYLVATTYDANGTLLGSTYDALTNMNPGERASFRIETWPYYKGYLVSQYSLIPDYNYVPTLQGKGDYYIPTPASTLKPAI